MRRGVAAGQIAQGQRIAQVHCDHESLGRVADGLLLAGLSLQTAIGLTGHEARQPITDAIRHLDDAIREIRVHVFRDLDTSRLEQSS
jgi:hypothetical protein